MELNEIIKPENLVYEKPRLMNDNPMHYCPGCSHGVIHKLIAEVVAERTRSQVVHVIGKKIVLYKPDKKNPKIILPQ